MRKLYSSEDRFMIQRVKEMLEGSGFSCIIKNEHLSSGSGELPYFDTWPEVWLLDDSRYDEAVLLLQSRFESQKQQTEWHCPGCGEVNGSAFETWWRCGKDAPRY